MKKIITPSAILFLVISPLIINGQIIINKTLFPLEAAFQDSLYHAQPSTMFHATAGANQTWNYSTLQKASIKTTAHIDAMDSTAFNALNYHRSDVVVLGSTLQSYSFWNIDNDGYYETGRFTKGFSMDLSSITGDAGDELVVPSQRSLASVKPFSVKFPAAMDSSWSSHNVLSLDYHVTVDGMGFNQTPGNTELHQIYHTEVIGSGQIIIPDENNNPLPAIDALLLETNITYIDSIFLSGMPVPTAQLMSFGLTQGATDSIKYRTFYAPGSGKYIASYYLDSQGNAHTFTYRPSAARKAAVFMSNKEYGGLNDLSLYPVPATSGKILNVEGASRNVQGIRLTDAVGNIQLEVKIENRDGNIEVRIPSHFSEGVYFLELLGDQKRVIDLHRIQVKP